MAKPKVEIVAPTALFVGQTHPIEVVVTADGETKIEFIDARLIGEQGWSIGSGKSRVTQHVKFPELVARLMGSGALVAGSTTRFATRFTIPYGTPPNHARAPAWATLTLRIHVSIPWRLDGRYQFPLTLRLPSPPHVERTPTAIRSTPMTAAADKPRIEVSLGSTRLVAGETVVGSCAVFHMDDRKPREVSLALVPTLNLHGRGRSRVRTGAIVDTTLVLPAGSAGSNIPFQLELPRSITPSFETVSHRLSWALVASSGSFFGTKVSVALPLEILDASAAAMTATLTTAPRLGDERIATVFASFATQAGWRTGVAGHDSEDAWFYGQFSIERDAGDGELRIAYAYRGEEGAFVVSQISHPPLGLDLTVMPSSLRDMFFQDVEVDIAGWDREHHVNARHPEQAVPPLRQVVPTLMRVNRLGTLVRWNDDEIVFEQAISALDEATLAVMGAQLAELAAAITAARPSIAPPAGMVVDLPAWQRLAAWLDGRFTVGDLSLDGTLDRMPVSAVLEWNAEGKPSAIRATVGDPEAASAEVRALAIALARPATDVLADPAHARIVERVAAWQPDVVDLLVSDGVASAAYVLPGHAPPVVETSRIRELIEALRGVLVALDPGAGPYR
ncbi:MAG: hypothetical protein ABI867_23415 [Kofleriaceae bacterium]